MKNKTYTDQFVTLLIQDYLKAINPHPLPNPAPTHHPKPPCKPLTLSSFINDQIDKLTSTFQLRVFNTLFLTHVHRLLPSVVKDNEFFMRSLCLYSYPDVYQKLVSEIQTRKLRLIERNAMNSIQMMFKEEMSSYIVQTNFWGVFNAHNFKE